MSASSSVRKLLLTALSIREGGLLLSQNKYCVCLRLVLVNLDMSNPDCEPSVTYSALLNNS